MKQFFILMYIFLVSAPEFSQAMTAGFGFDFSEPIDVDAFNPKNMGTLQGRVAEVLQIPKTTGMGNIVIVGFEYEHGMIFAMLGPDWYMKNQGVEIKKGDYLIVRGSKINYHDKVIMMATEITYNDKVIPLRNKVNGRSEWSEWRKDEGLFYKNYSL